MLLLISDFKRAEPTNDIHYEERIDTNPRDNLKPQARSIPGVPLESTTLTRKINVNGRIGENEIENTSLASDLTPTAIDGTSLTPSTTSTSTSVAPGNFYSTF